MSVLTYNNVTFPYPLATDYQQNARYDPTGKTDLMCTDFDITIQAIFNMAYLSMLAPDIAGGSFVAPVDIMNSVRSALLEPRRQLTYKFNGTDLIPDITSHAGTVDAQNGPMPQHCNVSLLTNDTFFISYRITGSYWEKISVSINSPHVTFLDGCPVLSNRWTETQEIDNCNYTTLHRNGEFIIRSDNQQGQVVDFFRNQMAVLAVPSTFLRQSSSYTVTADGLGLKYAIVDKEVFRKPPAPAFAAEGEYREKITVGSSGLYTAYCRVRLKGDNNTSQANLLLAAETTVMSKILRNGSNRVGIIQSRDVYVDLFNNEVEISVAVTLTRQRTQTGALIYGPLQVNPNGTGTTVNSAFAGMTFDANGNVTAGANIAQGAAPTTVNPKYQPPYLYRGTAAVILRAAAYFDPSINNLSVNKTTGQLSAGLQVGQAGTTFEG